MIQCEENVEIEEACNMGLQYASGVSILILSADEVAEPDACRKVLQSW